MIGKFHPLLVHLPIGFIYLAFLFETFIYFRGGDDRMSVMVKYMYLLATIIAAVTVLTGLLLASAGKYTPGYLQVHKLLGLAVLAVSALVYLIKSDKLKVSAKPAYLLSVLLIVILSIGGHYGGMLTHGKDYLFESGPSWLQRMAGVSQDLQFTNIDPDSVVIYRDIIQPVLDQKCTRCHNTRYAAGGLVTSDYLRLAKGGEDATGIVPRRPFESAIVTRVSLPVGDGRFMPPDGKVLSQTEFEVLKHWIARGADTTMQFDSRTIPADLKELLIRDFDLDYTYKPHYEKFEADSIAPALFKTLDEKGFSASFLGEDNFFLDIKFRNDTIDKDILSVLQQVASNIAFLDLSGTHFADSTFTGLAQFNNLVRLDLHDTNLTGGAVQPLSNLEFLEVLNLHHTPFDYNAILEALDAPRLAKLYLWETRVTPEELQSLRMSYPSIQFIGQAALEIHSDTTSNTDG